MGPGTEVKEGAGRCRVKQAVGPGKARRMKGTGRRGDGMRAGSKCGNGGTEGAETPACDSVACKQSRRGTGTGNDVLAGAHRDPRRPWQTAGSASKRDAGSARLSRDDCRASRGL